LLGALIVGGPGDRYGSRNMLRVVGMLYVISALGCALAWNFTSFVLRRFLAGIAIGGSSVLAPVYLAEIAPANRRGALVGLFQVNIVIGILLAHSSNLAVRSATHWIFKALIAGSFPVIAAHSKAAPFAFFASMMVLQSIAAFFLMPETRGVALERMNDALRTAERKVSRRNM
jgi:MFS family permease